jgi:hypothetical protein
MHTTKTQLNWEETDLSLTSSLWHCKLILAPIQNGRFRLFRNLWCGIIYSEAVALQRKNSNWNELDDLLLFHSKPIQLYLAGIETCFMDFNWHFVIHWQKLKKKLYYGVTLATWYLCVCARAGVCACACAHACTCTRVSEIGSRLRIFWPKKSGGNPPRRVRKLPSISKL